MKSDIKLRREAESRVVGLAAMMAVSGAVAVAYEVLWARMLGVVGGHGLITSSLVVATFMGGLGIGSWLAERPAIARRRPLAVYAALELGIACAGLAFPLLIGLVDGLVTAAYRAQSAGAAWAVGLELAWAVALLALPATLMGLTLPTVARVVPADRVGTLYAGNSLGGALGALIAMFVLVPALGHRGTGLALAGGGLALAAGAWALRGRWLPLTDRKGEEGAARRGGLALAFLCGACGMALQGAWTRGFVLFVGGSAQALALVLAVFIAGLALGAAVERRVLGWIREPQRAAAVALALAGIAAGASGAVMAALPAHLARLPAASVSDFGWVCGVQVRAVAWVTLPATLAFGMLWPLSVRMCGSTGRASAANTVGCVLGTLAVPFVTMPALGMAGTIALVAAALVTGAVIAIGGRDRFVYGGLTAALGLLVVAIAPDYDPALLSSGPMIAGNGLQHLSRSTGQPLAESIRRGGRILFQREGPVATVAVREVGGHTRTLLINGKPDASSHGDLSTQRLPAHLPLALVPDAADVLVIGLGSGVTAGSVLSHPIRRMTVLELSPEVVAASRYFLPTSGGPLDDPRTRLVLADARTHVMRTADSYDVITSEPTNPWIAGVGALFTREFFTACRARLRPGGVMVQWLQAYGLGDADFASVARTFRTVFPGATLWRSIEGADYLLVGRTVDTPISVADLKRALGREAVRKDLEAIGVQDELDLLSRFVCGPRGLQALAGDARLQCDDRMDLEFMRPHVMLEPASAELRRRLVELAEPVLSQLAVESNPGFVAALSLRQARDNALRLLARGDLDAAGEMITQIEAACEQQRVAPTFLKAVHLAAVEMLVAGGQPAEAASLIDALAQRHPDDADYAARLAAMKMRTRDAAGARAAYRRLLEHVRDSAAAHQGLAEIAEAEGLCETALDHWQVVRAQVPRDPTAAEAVVRLLTRLGRKAEARKALQLAILSDPGLEGMTLEGALRVR